MFIIFNTYNPYAVTIYVNADDNIPPVAANDSESTNEHTPLDIPVLNNDSDPDSDPLTNTGVVSGSGPSSGTVTLKVDGETFQYTPNPNFHGTDSFVYAISDGNGGTDTATGALLLDGWSMAFDRCRLFCSVLTF